MYNEQTTEIHLTEEELVEIVRRHFSDNLLACHNKRGGYRASVYYMSEKDYYRLEFTTSDGEMKK